MRKLAESNVSESRENIFRGKPGEVKHFSTQRKRKQLFIPQVAASENGGAQTCTRFKIQDTRHKICDKINL